MYFVQRTILRSYKNLGFFAIDYIFYVLVAKETLEGHQRAIMGMMSVEQIYRDRKTFSNRYDNMKTK